MKHYRLTKYESKVFRILLKNKNNLCKRDDILMEIWGFSDIYKRKSMNVLICRMRQSIQDTPLKITNVYGKGFILTGEADIELTEKRRVLNPPCR